MWPTGLPCRFNRRGWAISREVARAVAHCLRRCACCKRRTRQSRETPRQSTLGRFLPRQPASGRICPNTILLASAFWRITSHPSAPPPFSVASNGEVTGCAPVASSDNESRRVKRTRGVNPLPQENPQRKVKSHQQMVLALELRASGASFEQIGKSLNPPVSAPRAWKIVQKGLQAGRERMAETAQNLIQLQLNRLNRYRLKLEPNASDPAVVSTLVRVMERECKLMGIDAPTKIAETMPDGSPIETQESKPDFSKFTHDELLIFAALHAKAA